MTRKRQRPDRIVPIKDLAFISAKCIEVVADNGMRLRLPRSQVEFLPHAVVLPQWLYQKIFAQGRRHEELN